MTDGGYLKQEYMSIVSLCGRRVTGALYTRCQNAIDNVPTAVHAGGDIPLTRCDVAGVSRAYQDRFDLFLGLVCCSAFATADFYDDNDG